MIIYTDKQENLTNAISDINNSLSELEDILDKKDDVIDDNIDKPEVENEESRFINLEN